MLGITMTLYQALGAVCEPCRREINRRIAAGISSIKSSPDVQKAIDDLASSLGTAGIPEADVIQTIYTTIANTENALRDVASKDYAMAIPRLINIAAGVWEEAVLKTLEERFKVPINVPLVELQNLWGACIGAFAVGVWIG